MTTGGGGYWGQLYWANGAIGRLHLGALLTGFDRSVIPLTDRLIVLSLIKTLLCMYVGIMSDQYSVFGWQQNHWIISCGNNREASTTIRSGIW